MSYTPPPSPGHLRSPRDRALQIGTNPNGFSEIAYDAQAGVPASMSGGTYKSAGPFVSTEGAPINTPTPFANLKK